MGMSVSFTSNINSVDILEIHRPVARTNPSSILLLSILNLLLDLILTTQIEAKACHRHLGHHQSPERKGIAQHVGRFTVDLSGHDARTISHGLLQSNLQGSSVLRGDVHVDPCDIQPNAGVGGDSNEECSKVLYCPVGDG